MAEKNQQQDTSSAGGDTGSLLNGCDDVQITTSGADLIVRGSGTNSFTAEVAVVGTNCRSYYVCVWDGQKWVCD